MMPDRIGHPLVKLFAAFALVQGVFWLVFYPTFLKPPREPFAMIQVEAPEYARVSGDSAGAIAKAQFTPLPPAPQLREAGYHAVRGSFTLDKVPERGLALLSNTASDNYSYFVNGSFVIGRGSMDIADLDYRGNLRTIMHIPSASLVEGKNTVTVIAAIDVGRELVLLPPVLAPYEEATQKLGWIEFIQSDLLLIASVLTLALALLIGAVALRSSNRRLTLWLFALVAGWGLYTAIPTLVSLPFNGADRILAFTLCYILFATAWPAFIDEWSGHRLGMFQRVVTGLGVVTALLAIVWRLADPAAFGATAYAEIINWSGIVSVAVAGIRLIYHFVRHPEENRAMEGGILLMLLFLGGWYLYDVIVNEMNNGILARTQPFLLAALVIAFFAGRFHLFRSANQINTLLQEKLDLREAELAEAHQREKLLVRDQAFSEERTRIMRDMHDGLGSQLMGMLLAARRGKAEPERVAEGLQQVIDELRLMIDSMDSVGESLGVALAGFRTRLQPRVEDAGFAFEWENRLGDAPKSYPPRRTLQLFRIMQEAVANALKHSGGSKIAVALDTVSDEDDWLQVTVRDDGAGIAGPRPGGHGLDNMKARATKEGGRVEYGAAAAGEGGLVRILLPIGSQAGETH